MKISILKVHLRGKQLYMVSAGRMKGRKRFFFKTKTAAETQAKDLELQQQKTGETWLSLSAPQRAEIMAAWGDAEKKGVKLQAALEAFNPSVSHRKRVQAAFDEFMLARRAALASKRTLQALKSNVGRFVKTCAGKNLAELREANVTSWLQGLQPRTFNTYLTSLNTFFIWCVKRKFLKESPAAAVEKIDERRMADLDVEPPILTPEQCRNLLTACRDTDPELIPYVAVSLFAGLRPQREAARLTWQDVGADILVRGLHSKSRQRRYVTIQPVLAAWLARPLPAAFGPEFKKHEIAAQQGPAGGSLPSKNLRRRFEAVRRSAGLLEGWQQDCMRHTFASMSLVALGAAATIAALGHGNYDMLFGHYRALLKPEAAAKFWALRPDSIGVAPPKETCNSSPITPAASAPTPPTAPSTS